MEAAAARSSLPLTPTGQVDFSQDFFGEKVFLTVSGQLNGECVKEVFCFGISGMIFTDRRNHCCHHHHQDHEYISAIVTGVTMLHVFSKVERCRQLTCNADHDEQAEQACVMCFWQTVTRSTTNPNRLCNKVPDQLKQWQLNMLPAVAKGVCSALHVTCMSVPHTAGYTEPATCL